MANCLVTGAAGFIGYHLCEQLCSQGDVILGVDNISAYYSPSLKLDRLPNLSNRPTFEFQQLELSERIAVVELFRSKPFDVVFHFAAQPGVRYSVTNPHACIESNAVALMNVLEECHVHHVNHFLYASSSSVYGNKTRTPYSEDGALGEPESLYAVTKRANELMAATYSQLHGIRATGLRLFTVYGPWGRPDMAIYRFAEQMSRNDPIDVYNHGKMARDFTYIDDIVSGVLAAANCPLDEAASDKLHRVYNLGNNRPVELLDLHLPALSNDKGDQRKPAIRGTK